MIEATEFGDSRAPVTLNLEQVQEVQALAANIHETFQQPDGPDILTGQELDVLFPVGRKRPPASDQLHGLTFGSQATREVLATRDMQIAVVFAHVASAIVPNEVSVHLRTQKIGSLMRAMQSGVQQRFIHNEDYAAPRDASEAYTARLLHKAAQYIDNGRKVEFELAARECGLKYGPVRRAQNGLLGMAALVGSKTTN